MDTTIPIPPTKVTQYELEQMARLAGTDSPVYRRLAEQRADYVAWEQLRDAESARLRQAREARMVAEAQARAAAHEAQRAADEAAIREAIRRRFFAANPSASDADYERLSARLYDEELMRHAVAGRDADVEALRRRGDYTL